MKMSLPLDFETLHFCGEVRPGYGEDNWCYGFANSSGMIAVFDGCGGSGSRQHKAYQDHTEAFMAARLCAGSLYESMHSSFTGEFTAEALTTQVLENAFNTCIACNVPPVGSSSFKMKGLRTLPSTMASVLVQRADNGELLVSPIWAGDSRAYILDSTGLSQMTDDDSTQKDPMEGQYDDGILTNIICGDNPVNLHYCTYKVKPPFMVLAATDGCFGYVSTPMEFEGMILHTMLESSSVAQWEDNLRNLIGSFAHDDHTLCLASFGYGSFENIQKTFETRYHELRQAFLEPVWALPWEDRDSRRKLWAKYRPNYMKFIEGDDR